MNQMLFSIALVFLGLFAGYSLQRILQRRKPSVDLRIIRKYIQQIILLILIPPTIVFSLWIAPLRQLEIIYLPILGGLAPLVGGLAAWLLAGLLKLNRERRGLFTVSGIFTNMGSLGGLIVFLLLGEKGFALVALYQIFEKFDYFLIGFPVAKHHSSHRNEKEGIGHILLQVVKDPVILLNAIALVLGAILNFTELPRPAVFGYYNAVIVPLSSLALLISIGLAMKFGSVRHHLKAAGVIILIKSVFTPILITGLAYILGLGNFADGLALKTVFILSAMPVGFMSLIPPTLYDMDMDQANTCWLLSTLSLVAVIPFLQLLLPYIG